MIKNKDLSKLSKYNLDLQEKNSTFAFANRKQLLGNCQQVEKCTLLLHRGVEQLVARQAHNLEVACSSPASAT